MRRLILFFAVIIFQFLTSSVFAQVSEQWEQRFTSDSTRDETVNDMFVDAQGNVYVTGSQRGPGLYSTQAVTIKYNSLGVQQWIQNYIPPVNYGAACNAIHVDALGNVYVAGTLYIYGGAWEMLAIKYSSSGNQLWANRLYYGNNTTQGYDLITDDFGNVYVTGLAAAGGGSTFLVKYGSAGNLINQTAHHLASEAGIKIGLDGSGKIIIGGWINGDSLSFLALKYEQNLDFVWAATWGHQVGNQNFGDMAIDNNSNVILTGTSFQSFATVKINPAGVVQWGELYNDPSANTDHGSAVATDSVGNVFVTGQVGIFANPLSQDVAIIKYSPNGDEQWVQTLKPTLPLDGYYPNDITVDNSGDVYITGSTYGHVDIITAKYSTAGTFQWAASYNGPNPNNSSDYGIAVGVDQNGNAYVAGNSTPNDATTGEDIVTIKYSSTTGIRLTEDGNPADFRLEQNYPNPFNPTTKINYNIPTSDFVSLKVYDVLGNEIVTLVNEYKPAGRHEINFDASRLSSGVYFYKLQVGSFLSTKKMILIK